jgi:Flp pilus assembly CpaF family ATPase
MGYSRTFAHAIIPPLSLRGPSLTIRKFSLVPFTLEDLVARAWGPKKRGKLPLASLSPIRGLGA